MSLTNGILAPYDADMQEEPYFRFRIISHNRPHVDRTNFERTSMITIKTGSEVQR
jgi:hypothetical protein